MMFKFVYLLVFPPMEQVIRMCVVTSGYQKGITTVFYDSTFPSSSIESPYEYYLTDALWDDSYRMYKQ